MGLGLAHGSKTAGLRFRAEHAHKLPQTTTGWFLYHKSKNYHVAYGGIREGLRMGAKVSLWATAMFVVENMFDHYRGSVDAANTVLACVATAGGLSLWSTFEDGRPRDDVANGTVYRPVPPDHGGADYQNGTRRRTPIRRGPGLGWTGKRPPCRIRRIRPTEARGH